MIRPEPPEGSGPAARELGVLPAELHVRWPLRPRVREEVTLAPSGDDLVVWDTPLTRLRVRDEVERLVISASDVEVDVDEGMYVGALEVAPGSQRVWIRGGRYGEIVVAAPEELSPPPPEWRAPDMVEDVLIEGATVDALRPEQIGLRFTGRRVAVVSSRVDAQMAAVWIGDAGPVASEDVIVAGCSLRSVDDSTLVVVGAERAVIVESWLESPVSAALRIHGESAGVVATRNTLVGGGAQIGTDARDAVVDAWFWANTVYHSAHTLMNLAPYRIHRLVLTDNRVYSDAATALWGGESRPSWVIANNRVRPHRPPPARP